MLTDHSANIILNNLTGRSSTSNLSSGLVYVGLSTTPPNKDGTGYTEPVDNGYSRVLLGMHNQALTQKMSAANESETTNIDIVHFPEATGGWGTCTHFLIFNNATTGVLLAYEPLETPIVPVSGDVPIIRIGDLKITIDKDEE